MISATDPVAPATPASPVQNSTPLTNPAPVTPEAVPAEKKSMFIPVILVLIFLALLGVGAAIVFGNKEAPKTGDVTPTPTATVAVTETVTPSATDPATPTATVTETVAPTVVEKMTLKFYVFDSKKDPDVMDCGAPTFVNRELPKSVTTLADSVNYLLTTFKLTDNEKAAGLRNEFENPDYLAKRDAFKLKSATVNNLVASLTFEDPQAFSSGGSCRSSILLAQIVQTAKQFPTITSVKILPENTLFQP